MPSTDSITQKIISRLDTIDRQVLEQHLSDLSQTCALYRELFKNLDEGVLLLDRLRTILLINDRALDLLGLPDTERNKKKWLNALADPALAPFMIRNLNQPQMKKVEEVSVIRPRELHLRFFFMPLPGSAEAQTAIFIVDRTQEQTRTLEREQLSRMTDLMNLTAGIAHEIGNPLNALSIHMQLLKKENRVLPDKHGKAFTNRLSVMESEINRLDKIIRNFLRATRRAPLRFSLGNLNTLIEEILDVMRPEALRQKVKVEFYEDSKLPLFLMDRLRLYQAMINLIKNSLEAMPRGGRLLMRLTHRDRVAALRIEDSGCGISEEHLPHIFDAFYTTKEQGTGLGLVSVFQAVSEHGGKIDVSSTPGKGTVFTLYLPLRVPKLQIVKA